MKEETPSKKPQTEFKEKKAPYQRINIVYTTLTVPITQALMTVEGKWLLARPREKARGTGPYRRKEADSKGTQRANPEASPIGGPKVGKNEKTDPNDTPRKGIIRMITGGLIGGDSHHARKAEIRKAHDEMITEVLDVETMKDAPIIQFGRVERSRPRSAHNDALVITVLLANYEVKRIFIDSESSADILFGDAFDQMQLGDTPLEEVNTSLYSFTGEVVHPRGLISLPLTLGAGGVREVKGDPLQSRKCYVEAVQKGQKRGSNEAPKETPYSKRGREGDPEEDLETNKNLEGISPEVIAHHLNIDHRIKPVKQKKRHFGPEKDKIIQAEIDKLMAAGYVEEIQFPEWLSNVVLVPKPSGNGECASTSETSTKLVLKTFILYPE
ncbi:UNVERIFIED_CONTAM: hypothetical protein Sradi_3152400 [Sesamum radiatum]|uniref:Gag-pol polyprotein n=1 Tax=Sesamum radiatum TaxID=300843 RepID=A0AAW2REJ9_SESRA